MAVQKKGEFAETKLRFMTNALSVYRNGLVIDVESSQATGRAKWDAAIRMIDRNARAWRQGGRRQRL